MTQGAIPQEQDAPAAAVANAGVDLNDPNVRLTRADAMKLMASKRRDELVADGYDLDGPGDASGAPAPIGDEDENADDARAEAARRELAASQGTQAPAPASDGGVIDQVGAQRSDPTVLSGQDLARYRVTKKVNGVETVVSVDEVLRDAQKTDAADAYLARAKQTVEEANRLLEAARVKAGGAVVNAPGTSDGSGATDPNQDVDPLIDDFVAALFQGDEATTKAKLKAAIQRSTGPGPAVDTDALAATVEQRIVTRTANDAVAAAVKDMLSDYPDLAASQALRIQADEFLAKDLNGRALTEFRPREIRELVMAAGQRTMDWFRPGGASTQNLDQTLSERRAQKAGIDEPPRAATRASSSQPAPRTNSDVIGAMKAQRGQVPGAGGRQ